MSLRNLDVMRIAPPAGAAFGHAQFWERAVSRRSFIAGAAAGIGGTAFLAGFPLTVAANGMPGAPRPVQSATPTPASVSVESSL